MRTLAVLCLVLLSRVQAAPQGQDVTSVLGQYSADVSVANDVLRRVSSLGSVLSRESSDSSSSSASQSSSSLPSNVASEKSSSDSSAAASPSSSSSLPSSATLDKSSVESPATFSSSPISANAASEKSSVDSASPSLAYSSAQSFSDSDVHHVDSGKSKALSGFSSSASSVAAAGNAGVAAKPEVSVDSVKAEQHKAAAAPPAPPATSGLTVKAVDTSSPDTDIPLKKVPVYASSVAAAGNAGVDAKPEVSVDSVKAEQHKAAAAPPAPPATSGLTVDAVDTSSPDTDIPLKKVPVYDSSAAASSSSLSSVPSSATLNKSSVESPATFSPSSISANAASEKSSVDSASPSLAYSSAQSFSDSDVHHVDSGKSKALSGFSSSASSVAAAGNAGVAAKPEVSVDSVKAEQHKAAAAPPAPPATSGLTVEAVDTSSPDTDIPLKKVPVYASSVAAAGNAGVAAKPEVSVDTVNAEQHKAAAAPPAPPATSGLTVGAVDTSSPDTDIPLKKVPVYASSVADAGNAGDAAKPEVSVDSVKAEQHKAAAAPPAPPATSGLTVEAVDTSSPDTDIPLKKVPVYVPVEYSASYQPENFFNPYSSVSRYSPYLTSPYGAIPYRTAAMPWYRLVSPEVPILTLYSGESQGADVQRETLSPWAPMPYAKVGLACAHPESRWGYAPTSGLVAASPLPYSPVVHPTYRLHHPAAVLGKTSAPWSHVTTVEPSLEIAKAAGPWTHVVAAEPLPLSPVALPTYRLHLPAATPAAVLGKTSAPWSHVVATEPSLEIAKAAGPWSPVYGPVQKLYIPDNLALPEHVDLGKTSSFSVSPWIPLRAFAGHSNSAWSSGHETAPVVGIEKASPVPSPWISLGSPSNADGIANVVPWAVSSAGAPWGFLRNHVGLAKSPVYSASSGLDLARRSSSTVPVWIPVSNAGITRSAPAEVEFPWIPLEASSPMNTGKSSSQFPLVWNPVLEQTLKEQRASGYPGSTYTSPRA